MYLVDEPNICQLDGMDDSILDDLDEAEDDNDDIRDVSSADITENKHDGTKINIINTNARSLCPKID